MSKENKAKYKITIEVVGDEEMTKRMREDMDVKECDGFVIIANNKDDTQVLMHSVSGLDIAQAIAGSNALMSSSYLAEGIRKARDAYRPDVRGMSLSDMLRKIIDD